MGGQGKASEKHRAPNSCQRDIVRVHSVVVVVAYVLHIQMSAGIRCQQERQLEGGSESLPYIYNFAGRPA